MSSKNQVTIPVVVLAEAGLEVGEFIRVEALGPGRVLLTRDADGFDDLLGALDGETYPTGYLEKLRAEWE
ncbi:MAG: AbrB/MazE/SpoVT family DNA-binding domain-containing protein [Lapillicoccus sp.]